MMESIDKLREWSHDVCGDCECDKEIQQIADEIEREIAERYMELPLDADGVPVKLGDTIGEVDNCDRYTFTVEGYTSALPDGIGELMLVDDHDDCWYPSECRHVNPRTIEDVLRELVDSALDGTGRDPLLKDWSALVVRYADEIRGLL